ncbi:MAG: glycosyltransferase family 4 protein [Anaerolineae bacterium]
MHILHTESSNGWGGQEIRILREAEGMREKGYEVVFAITKGGGLVARAREKGFFVYELNFKKSRAFVCLVKLMYMIAKHGIDLVNTHSSLDAWTGGIAARIMGKRVIRTRHLSTAIKPGLNSLLLYNKLADIVVTTCSSIIPSICMQANLSASRCLCIPTGVDRNLLQVSEKQVLDFRKSLKIVDADVLVGTACFVRSWKGIRDFMRAAALLKRVPRLKWVIIGGGYVDEYRDEAQELGLQEVLTFTGHLDSPYAAIRALDIFALLSTAHEGVSQASLQAAYLERPLITTSIGGLPEVCIDGKTGVIVPPRSPEKFAEAVLHLVDRSDLRYTMGKAAKLLVEEKFTIEQTLEKMHAVYSAST